MHKFAKQIMECVKAKVDGMGIDNINGSNLEELKEWSCIAKDIAEYDYYYNIVKAMEESGAEYGKDYDENGRYYTRMRDGRGRYMRRGYEDDMHIPEYYRDMDRDSNNSMYYSEMPRHESRYDRARRGYQESKMKHMGDDPENMDAIETIFDVLQSDIEELKPKMTANEMSRIKSKLNTLSSMM